MGPIYNNRPPLNFILVCRVFCFFMDFKINFQLVRLEIIFGVKEIFEVFNFEFHCLIFPQYPIIVVASSLLM